jgi:hypothetical protein
MSEQNLFRNYLQLMLAIKHCIKENLVMPALVLIYTAIDSVSWLAMRGQASKVVGQRFQGWVNDWMLKAKGLPCTAEELYAARYGVLHTLTPDSSLSTEKGVRRVLYAWGNAKVENLQKSIDTLQEHNVVAIHLNDLFEAFRLGFADFIDSTMKDPEAAKHFVSKAAKHFANIDKKTMDTFLRSARHNKSFERTTPPDGGATALPTHITRTPVFAENLRAVLPLNPRLDLE